MGRLIQRFQLIVLIAAATVPAARAGIELEILGGAALNQPSRMRLEQAGAPDLEFTARYETRPLETPPYYALRISTWRSRRAWAIDLLHHKLYVTNPPPEVQDFSITHGFNLVTLQHRWNRSGTLLAIGAGVVIAHPESRVRGREFMGSGLGYTLTGPVLSIAGGRRFRLTGSLSLSLEIRGTAAYAKVPIHDGDAHLTHFALHGLVGLARRF